MDWKLCIKANRVILCLSSILHHCYPRYALQTNYSKVLYLSGFTVNYCIFDTFTVKFTRIYCCQIFLQIDIPDITVNSIFIPINPVNFTDSCIFLNIMHKFYSILLAELLPVFSCIVMLFLQYIIIIMIN